MNGNPLAERNIIEIIADMLEDYHFTDDELITAMDREYPGWHLLEFNVVYPFGYDD